uniref:DUF1853 family protein n=1 Tax=Piscirickettsia litoralis TaxID=1891921 RepID=UPI0022868D33|nr:DUF1853 family protein [Piscirickettsia litoralis]
MHNWLGPNCKDRLDLKFNQLIYQQSQLSKHPDSHNYLKQNQLNNIQPAVLVKGYLFTPLHLATSITTRTPEVINPESLQGWWTHLHHIPALLNADSTWILLNKPHWLAPPTRPDSSQLFTKTKLYQHCLDYFKKQQAPLLVCELNKNLQEQSRGFITPNTWPF